MITVLKTIKFSSDMLHNSFVFGVNDMECVRASFQSYKKQLTYQHFYSISAHVV